MILSNPSFGTVMAVVSQMRDADAEEIWAMRQGSDADLARDSVRAHLSYAACTEDGDPVAVFGATQLWAPVWQAFMFATDRWPEVAFEVSKFIRRGLIPGLVRLGAYRVHCYSHANHSVAHEWLEFLGADQEARLKSYGSDGSDFFVYAWVKPYVQQRILRSGQASPEGRETS